MSLDLGAIVARATIEDGPFQVKYGRLVRQLGDLGRKATVTATETERLDESLAQTAASSSTAATGLGRAQRAMTGAGLSASDATAATQAYKSVLTEAGVASSKLTQAQLRQQSAIERMTALQESGTASTRQLASAQASLIAATDRVAVAEERAGKAAGFQSEAWHSAGRAATVTGLVITAGFVMAGKAAAGFDAKMALVRTLARATPPEMEQLRDAALHVGQAYGYSANQVADAEAELVKAGISVKDILGGALRGALTLAAAGQEDVASATETAAFAMTQFGLTARDVPHIADLLAAGADKALGSVADLSQALKYGGLAASQAGFSIDDTIGVLAELAQSAQIGTRAGQGFQMMLRNLQHPSQAAAGLMDKYGISIFNASGQMLGITEIAGQLHDKLGPLNDEQQKAALATLFNANAVRAATVLMRGGADAAQEWINKVNDSGFAALQAAGKMDSLTGDATKLKSALQEAFIGTGEDAQGPLRTLTQDVTSVVQAWNNLPQPVKTGAEALVGVSGAVLLVGGGLLVLLPRIQKTREAMDALGISGRRVGGILGKGGILIGALTAAVIAVGEVDNAMHHTSINADAMTASLENLARTGRVTGEIARAFGDDMSNLKNTVDLSARGVSVLGLHFHNIGDTFTHTGGAFKDARDRIASVDQALSDLVTSGHADEAAAAYSNIADAAKAQGVSMSKLVSRFPEYSGSLRASAESAQVAGSGIDKYGNAVSAAAAATKSATDAAKAYADQLHSLADPLFALNSALQDLHTKQKAVTDAVKKHGAASKAARQAQLDLASSSLDVEAAASALAASVEDGSTSLSASRQMLRDWVRDGLVTKSQADAIRQSFAGIITQADKLSRTHPHLRVTADTGQAVQALAQVRQYLGFIHDKTVDVRVRDLRVGQGPGGQLRGTIPGQALGGPVWGPGTGTSDSVLRRLSTGEFVVRADGSNLDEAQRFFGRQGSGSGRPISIVVQAGPFAEQIVASVPRALREAAYVDGVAW